MLTAVKIKNLLSSPSPHKQPLRPGRGESILLLQLLNHSRPLYVHACWRGSVGMAWSCWMSCLFSLLWLKCSSGCFMLWCAYSWESAEFSSGKKELLRAFLAIHIILAPHCYKEDTLLHNLIFWHSSLTALKKKINITLNIDPILIQNSLSCTLAPWTLVRTNNVLTLESQRLTIQLRLRMLGKKESIICFKWLYNFNTSVMFVDCICSWLALRSKFGIRKKWLAWLSKEK